MLADENDELVFQARVEDFTKEFFKEFDNNVDKVAQKTEQGFAKVNNTVKDTGQTMAIVGGVIAGVANQVAGKVLEMTDQFIHFLEESEKVAERTEALGVSLKVVGENAGISMLELKNLTDGMEGVGLSTADSRESLLKMIQAELDLKDSSKLAEIAVNAAAIGGTTSMQALEKIIQSITYQSPRMVKSLGLVVDFQDDIKRSAAELGRQLTDTEKKQIALNAILEQGRKIEGAYAESLTTVQGQRALQADLVEKLREQAGSMFTGASYESLKAANEILKEIFDYLEEHKDTLDEMGENFTSMAVALTKVTKEMIALIGMFSGLDAGVGIIGEMREQWGMSAEPIIVVKDIVKALNDLLMISALSIVSVRTGFQQLAMAASTLTKLKLGFITDDQAREELKNFPSVVDEVRKAYEEMSAPLHDNKVDLDNVTEATNNAAEAAANLAEVQAEKLASAVKEASAQLQKLKDSQELAAAERAIKAQRAEIEEELKLQWDREDQERNHLERVQGILENAEESRQSLAEQYAENRYQIEVDYRKRLSELLENYNFEASELARKRDAIGLLSLARQYKRDLEKEKKAQEERRSAATEAYQKSVADLEKSVQKQLASAEEARTKELESYQRNLDRQKELKTLHNQWEEEDRQRELQRALEQLVKGFSSIEGMTAEGLQTIVNQWGAYFGALPDIVASSMSAAAQIYNEYASKIGTSSGVVTANPDYHYDSENLGAKVKGASGLVSDLLTPEGISNASKIGQTPYVRASSGRYERRDINVKVDGSGLDPYIQRKLVRTLEEIERNRG
jgi:hypothetical protein